MKRLRQRVIGSLGLALIVLMVLLIRARPYFFDR
jgi:hypothetical protein